LAFEPKEKDIMSRKPEAANIPILTREMNSLIFIIGLLTNFILFGIFWWFWKEGYPLEKIRSIMFVGLAIDSFMFIFSCRNLHKNIWHYNPFSNFYLTIAVFLGMLLLIAAIYLPSLQILLKSVPLGFFEWIVLIGFGFLNLILIEITKWYYIRKSERKNI